jgi:dTDP-glucose 4,6-dehydratase
MIQPKLKISGSDLQEIFDNSISFFDKCKGKSIFISGGSGFFGKWLISSILYANKFLDEKIHIKTITRNLDRFKNNYPDLSNSSQLTLLEGDLASLENIEVEVDYFIHCAANVITSNSTSDRASYIQKEKENTDNVLSFCKRNNVKRIIFTSSGAVYGNKNNLTHPSKEDSSPEGELTPYGESKLISEELISTFCINNQIEFNTARCFAFLGGYIPLEGSFAAGNFINNMLSDKDIIINSDGQALRSFMYMTDLCIALFKLLSCAESGLVLNVGSSKEVSIKDLAFEIVKYSPKAKVIINKKELSETYNKYIPDMNRASNIMNIKCHVSFSEAVKRTIAFYKGSDY